LDDDYNIRKKGELFNMELTQTDFDILNAIQSGRVGAGTPVNHFVDYCDNAIGGNPRPLIEAGYIKSDGDSVNGLTDKGLAAWKDFKDKHPQDD
jgi:hypothetical protein